MIFLIMNKISFLLIFILFDCCLSKYPRKWEKKEIALTETKTTIKIGEQGKRLKALYTGCGGMILDQGNEAIATDPFFSNQPFMSIQLGKIFTRPEAVQSGLQNLHQANIDPQKIKHVLIEHSHYDHLMDVPYLLDQKFLNDSVSIYGGMTSFNILHKFLPSISSFVNIDSSTHHPKNRLVKTGKWMYLNPELRILPIESSHAPHFLNIELMHGEVGERGLKGFEHPLDKTKASQWKRGNVYSFLVDYLNKEKIELRIFIQSSSCEYPYGLPPEFELSERKVDIAFIGVASSQNVKDYPQSLIKTLNPSRIILIHWEDFFRPYGKAAKTVRFTNFNKFFKRLSQAQGLGIDQMKGKVIMPKPGTLIELEY
jgi:hypothetical protein